MLCNDAAPVVLLKSYHFAAVGVPPTALVSAFVNAIDGGAVKVGSLQQFVEAEGDCEERGYSSFPVQEVHKIAVLVSRKLSWQSRQPG